MPTNLTGTQIKDTYSQILHVDGGPEATEKTVYSAVGVATAFRVGTGSVSVDNVRIDGNTISTFNTNGNLVLSPNGTGAVVLSPSVTFSDPAQARTSLGLGTIATQAANNVTITGGSITGVVFTGSFSGITAITSDAFYTSAAAAGLTLTNNDLLADGTDTNIDIDIIPKGTGEVNISKVDINGGTIDGTSIGATSVSTVRGSTVLATQGAGYAAGAGGTVTQLTSRTTGVTLNQACGEITLFAGSLAGHEADEFTLTNSEIAATDVVIVNIKSGAAAGTRKYYTATVTSVSAGSCTISIGNNDNGSVPAAGTDTLVLSFAVIKGVTS